MLEQLDRIRGYATELLYRRPPLAGREPPGDAFDGFVPPAFWPSAMHFWNIIAPLEHFCCYRFAHRNPRCARTTAPEGGIFG